MMIIIAILSFCEANMLSASQIADFFNSLNKNNSEIVLNYYHPQAELIDPVGTHVGSADIKNYYANMYKNVSAIHFEFSKKMQEGETVVLVWDMSMKVDGLNSGREIVVPGSSIITLDKDSGLIIKHHDLFDMGAMVYEHIPVFGRAIKYIKNRLKSP